MTATFSTMTTTGNLATTCVFRGHKGLGSKMIVIASNNRSVQEWLYQYLELYTSKNYIFFLVEREIDFSEYAGKIDTVMVFIEDIFFGEKTIGKLDFYRKQYPKLQIILFSSSVLPLDEAARYLFWSRGSYLSLRDNGNNIKESIKAIFEKRKTIPSYLRDNAKRYEQLSELEPHLTHREIEIIRHAVNGNTSKETAAVLMLSHRTVQQHTYNIYRKFGIHNMVGVLRLAVSKGIITVDELKTFTF